MNSLDTLLPSSPLALCEDRFSLLPTDSESDDSMVSAWAIIVCIITSKPQTVERLVDNLETIAVCLRYRTNADFGHLRQFLRKYWDSADFLARAYPILVSLALELPLLFPSGVLPALSSSSPYVLSRRQVACLIVHQFLCTLSPPSWLLQDSSQDFHIWYESEQPHPRAACAYLFALFTYFNRITTELWIMDLPASEWPIRLTLHSSSLPATSNLPFSSLTMRPIPTASADPLLLGTPGGACVISANKYIGFGRTGTQEETHVGCSPEAYPAMLFTPPLQDNQVLIVEGVEAMISMEGYGRSAAFGKALISDYDCDGYRSSAWRRRTMLFMDALELDFHDSTYQVPDFLPGNIERELTKAYIAFSSRSDEPYNEVVTGLWGCGAFGGNPKIKTLLQWCAASLAHVSLTFVCDATHKPFLDQLEHFSGAVIQHGWTVGDVLSVIRSLDPEDERATDIFAYTSAILIREQ